MTTGKTKAIGIIGWPVGHSLSPLIHNAAFAGLGLDYTYIPLPVQPGQLGQGIAGLKALGFSGANVTVPYKVAVMDYLDEIHASAQLVGAVNTIVVQEGRCIGYNTDAEGFILSLKASQVDISGKNAVLLGAGGAARAVVCGLMEHGIRKVTIGARNAGKAGTFAGTFEPTVEVVGCGWQENIFQSALGDCDILIQCTSLGMFPRLHEEPPLDWQKVNCSATVCDLIYNPRMTQFLLTAAGRGHKVVGGEGMLVEQGAYAFFIWTGQQAPRDIMYKIINEQFETMTSNKDGCG
ncbi:MAG TPA: shikimate dehydrogenase [Negativicutes bacterium]